MMAKERLDLFLVKNEFFPSRERARSAIMEGRVLVNGQKIDKAGTLVSLDIKVTLCGHDLEFVSRGGLKLKKALATFSIDLSNKTMIDIGASTGGFTDCALKNGAARVFAIDVGYGQLAWSLRTDDRVVNMERTNIRKVTLNDIGTAVDFISIDVAFISLDKVLPVATTLLKTEGELVALIKPQFEAGREKIGKKGVVKDAKVHQEVIQKVMDDATDAGFFSWGLTFSPVKGPEGNIEYLLYLKKIPPAESLLMDKQTIHQLVAAAHDQLTRRAEDISC
ncbi:23S rRNA (cytidine1920-2'-O)/16S rRNA (cytidine1409-2'-O)-methyltransferase [Sporomusaceae bacterium BoRhaA]|nr:23S rRNA (cytidine1920-2'-O)/16S rRNA (cytidine1409-2'-O)-methyltransferase [Pelorhabdus rhamnosifermentans]